MVQERVTRGGPRLPRERSRAMRQRDRVCAIPEGWLMSEA